MKLTFQRTTTPKIIDVQTTIYREVNVGYVGCCNAAGVYIPQILILKKVRNLQSYKQDLLHRSNVRETESVPLTRLLFGMVTAFSKNIAFMASDCLH
jgi:hypothetical protein